MRLNAALIAILAAALLQGCTGLHAVPESPRQASLLPLHDTAPGSLALLEREGRLAIEFNEIGAGGSFCRVLLPDQTTITESGAKVDDGLLVAVMPVTGGADIGVVPLASDSPASYVVELNSLAVTHRISTPPTGTVNRVLDLTVSEVDAEQVLLKWTEVNTGDYDFNGEVNIADLSPLAKYFGAVLPPNPENPLEQTLYWIDGDKNLEVNIADIMPIALNYGYQVAGYRVFRNGSPLSDPASQEPQLFSRAAANFRLQPDPLPPLYSAIVNGTISDSWSVVPVDFQGMQGSFSADVIIGSQVDAKASVVISGINLWRFPGTSHSAFDGGFSLLRVILPGDDVDWAEIGEKFVKADGVAVFSNLPRNTQLFLEIAYAPKTDLLSGVPVSQADATANPLRTRMPFMLPDVEGQVEFAPELEIISTELGISIDLYSQLVTAQGTETYRSRLLLPDGLVSTDTDGDGSYIDQPFLKDSDFDSVSDQRIQLVLDLRDYEGGTQLPWVHKGKVAEYNQSEGYIVLSEAEYLVDAEQDIWAPEPDPQEVRYEFYELTEFLDPASTYMDPDGIVLGEVLRISGFSLSNLSKGLLKKHWAETISRPAAP